MFGRCICAKRRESYDLSCSNLNQVPVEVSRHKSTLVELILDSNHLNNLGKYVYSCSKLQRLYVCNNNLASVPNEIGYLTNLIELNLSHNEIDDISDDIRRCESIKFLDISNNNIRRIPDGIHELYALEVLNVNECSLNEIPEDIKMLTNLRTFEARDNLIDLIPDSIGNIASLTRLDLGCNEISSLTPEISKLTNLSELWLDTNILSSIPNEIGYLRSLTMLELSNNPIKVIPDSICELENLKELALTSNQIGYLPLNIGNLKKLENLKLDFNRVTELPKSIGFLENLIELSLLGNQLTSLPNTIGSLKKLICIYADGNKLSDLPDEICECSSLNILSIRDNSLSQLPNNFGNLSSMGVVELRGNRIQFLPKSMSRMKSLRCLWLTSTQQRPLYELQLEHHPEHGEILTCFLLPQREKDSQCNPSVSNSDVNYNPSAAYYNPNFNVSNKSRLSSVDENPEYEGTGLHDDGVKLGYNPRGDSLDTSNLLNSLQFSKIMSKDDELVNISVISDPFKKESFTDNYDDNGLFMAETTHKHNECCGNEFFKSETVEFSFQNGLRGFSICGGIDQIHHVFGNSESTIFVSDIEDSEFMNKAHLNVGDRIISINGITMSLVTNEEANRLLDLHQNFLKLHIRHDPPCKAFNIVTLIREDTTEKFGITMNTISEGPSRCSPLVVTDVSENGIAYATGQVKKGMWLIEVNDKFLICYTKEKATQLLANLTGFVRFVFYNPEYAESQSSKTEELNEVSLNDDINGNYINVESPTIDVQKS